MASPGRIQVVIRIRVIHRMTIPRTVIPFVLFIRKWLHLIIFRLSFLFGSSHDHTSRCQSLPCLSEPLHYHTSHSSLFARSQNPWTWVNRSSSSFVNGSLFIFRLPCLSRSSHDHTSRLSDRLSSSFIHGSTWLDPGCHSYSVHRMTTLRVILILPICRIPNLGWSFILIICKWLHLVIFRFATLIWVLRRPHFTLFQLVVFIIRNQVAILIRVFAWPHFMFFSLLSSSL